MKTMIADMTDTSTVELAPAAHLPAAPNGSAAPIGFGKVATAISAVMNEIGIIAKEGTNSFHHYKYAQMQDILQKLTPLLAKNGLVIFQTEVGRAMFDEDRAISVQYQFTIAHTSGEAWPDRPLQTGLSRCRDSKGGFDDKALNKCHTAARKYFLLALFQIPTGEEDDADSHETGRRQAPTNVKPPPPAASVAAPIDPETGEISPHKIAYDDNAIAWGSKYVAALKTATLVTDLAQWQQINQITLDKIKESAPKVYGRIHAAQEVRRKELDE